MNRKRAFTLIEFIIIISIVMLSISVSVEAFMALNKDCNVLISYLGSYLKGREIIDIMSRDCRMAIRLMGDHAGYTTSTGSIVLKVPSVDSDGNIIDIDHNYDYIIYKLKDGDLWRIVIPGPSSARPAYNGIFKRSIETLAFTVDGTPLSGIIHVSAVTHLTISVSISEQILGKYYKVLPGTTVKFMNYEWGYIR